MKMLPRWHILFGAIFSLLIWLAVPEINPLYIALTFFASVFIDLDHYFCSLLKTKKLSLLHAFEYHKEMAKIQLKEKKLGIKNRGDFHLFHTVEFHIFIGFTSFFWIGFFYVFLGMIFHSLVDIYSLLFDNFMYRREFFLTAWLWKKFKNK